MREFEAGHGLGSQIQWPIDWEFTLGGPDEKLVGAGKALVAKRRIGMLIGQSHDHLQPAQDARPRIRYSFIKWLCLYEVCHNKMAAHPY